MTKSSMKKQSKLERHKGGNWDGIWSQEGITKQLTYLRKIGIFYVEITGLLSKFLNKYLKNDKKYSIIELGCGGSSYLPYLERKYPNLQLFGIDKSPTGCKLAAEGVKGGLSSANIICGDILQPPLKSKKFDIVFSVGLIEHFDYPDNALKAHTDLLKPGGLLICFIPNVLGLQGNFFRFLTNKIIKTGDKLTEESKDWIWRMKIISVEELKSWLTDFGLTDINIGFMGGVYPMLMMESYRSDDKSLSVKLTYFLYRYLLFLPFIAINIPFLFRLNSKKFSPLIVAVGKKINGGY